MAENEATAVAETEEKFQYPVKIEDLGPGEKKIHVEIPRADRQEARQAVPGSAQAGDDPGVLRGDCAAETD